MYYALDSKEPVLNGRGRDIRRIYHVVYTVGGVENTISMVASCLMGAYTVFENVLGKPSPEIIKIWSTEMAK